jgi:hypothetical protein
MPTIIPKCPSLPTPCYFVEMLHIIATLVINHEEDELVVNLDDFNHEFNNLSVPIQTQGAPRLTNSRSVVNSILVITQINVHSWCIPKSS